MKLQANNKKETYGNVILVEFLGHKSPALQMLPKADFCFFSRLGIHGKLSWECPGNPSTDVQMTQFDLCMDTYLLEMAYKTTSSTKSPCHQPNPERDLQAALQGAVTLLAGRH